MQPIIFSHIPHIAHSIPAKAVLAVQAFPVDWAGASEAVGDSHAHHDLGLAKLCIRRTCRFAVSPAVKNCSQVDVRCLGFGLIPDDYHTLHCCANLRSSIAVRQHSKALYKVSQYWLH